MRGILDEKKIDARDLEVASSYVYVCGSVVARSVSKKKI